MDNLGMETENPEQFAGPVVVQPGANMGTACRVLVLGLKDRCASVLVGLINAQTQLSMCLLSNANRVKAVKVIICLKKLIIKMISY